MCKIDERFTINSDVKWKRLGSQIVTLHEKTHQYHVLNEAAALIFERSVGKDTVEAVARELAKRLKISEEQALEDTKETVDGMVKLGLLVGTQAHKAGYVRPAIRTITEEDFRESIASGAQLVCRSLIGA